MSNLELYTTLAVALLTIATTFNYLTVQEAEQLEKIIAMVIEALVAAGWIGIRKIKTR